MELPEGYTKFDAADLLNTEEDIAAFLAICAEDNDPELMAHALGAAARARGMTGVAKKTGLTRAALYQALSKDGNPTLSTLMKVLSALGLQLKVVPTKA